MQRLQEPVVSSESSKNAVTNSQNGYSDLISTIESHNDCNFSKAAPGAAVLSRQMSSERSWKRITTNSGDVVSVPVTYAAALNYHAIPVVVGTALDQGCKRKSTEER